jgi:hypothetical protein
MPCKIGSQTGLGKSTTRGSLKNFDKNARTSFGSGLSGDPKFTIKSPRTSASYPVGAEIPHYEGVADKLSPRELLVVHLHISPSQYGFVERTGRGLDPIRDVFARRPEVEHHHVFLTT